MKKKEKKKSKTIVYGTSAVSSRGQLVLPAKLRKAQNVQQGDTLVFTGVPGSDYFHVLKAKAFEGFEKDLQDLLLTKDEESEDKGK